MAAETKSKVAIVTGGAQGIGRATAKHLLSSGWAVAIIDADEEAGRECEAEYGNLGPLLLIHMDVGSEDAVRSGIGKIVEKFGRIDGLINNAGISGGFGTPVESLDLQVWDRVIRTNLTGAVLMSKYTVPHLRKSCGAIVNISSTRALQSEPHTEAYSASKGGLLSLTHALAVSLSGAVRVNCISPGWIEVRDWKKASRREEPVLSPEDHAQHPAGRVGRPEDIAAMVGYLLSGSAGFITGQNFVVDGGLTKRMIYLE